MTIHKTKSGWIELLGKWREGQGPGRDYANMPAVITDDDGDGHYGAWKVQGTMRDAAEVLGPFLLHNDGRSIAILEGSRVISIPTPDDFWIGKEPDEYGEFGLFKPNLAAYPDVVAW